MMFKLLFLILCACSVVIVFGYRPQCDKKYVLRNIRIPTYHFSVRILDRISEETDGHFVFSPIATWLQLLSIADGARGSTLNEILKVTRNFRIPCLRKYVIELFNSLNDELRVTTQHRSIIAIDYLLNVKHSFIRNVEKLYAAKVLLLNFKTKIYSAEKINALIKEETNGRITESVDSYDFNRSLLLMIDVACMKANWRNPFNSVYTKPEKFYSYEKISIGTVNMMHQIGYFNTTFVPYINANALELQFNDRLSMILFLPKTGTAADLFWSMRKIRLYTIWKLLEANGPKLINVKIPRFKQSTDVDNIPELLHDMGIEKIFHPRAANLSNISKYRLSVSMMINKADIDVTETGVLGTIGPELLITSEKSIDMFFNQPFAYVIADKITNVILFAGIYSEPSLY